MNVSPADNTASVLTKRGGFRRREQSMYRLPVLIVDSGSPALSSTNTLSVRVCDCDSDGVALSCGAVAYTATGLRTGALMAILGCIITLLGKICMTSVSKTRVQQQQHSAQSDRYFRGGVFAALATISLLFRDVLFRQLLTNVTGGLFTTCHFIKKQDPSQLY